jgi:tetratricopeptide (TPR) repeat protein
MANAESLKDQGIQQFMQQDYERAAETFRAARSAYEAAGEDDLAAEMRVNLGLALHSVGQYDAALAEMQAARDVFLARGDQSRLAQALGNMGRVYAKLGNTEQAITNYREASALFMEIGDEENYGQTVLAIADLQLRGGHVTQAAATYEVGLDYVKHPNARQKLMRNLLGLRNRLTGQATSAPDKDE